MASANLNIIRFIFLRKKNEDFSVHWTGRFEYVTCMKREEVDPTTYITHRLFFDLVKDGFEGWLNPVNGVIKAMVEMT